jgi:pimeloyl-ACP methyl ester carboxylesterase
MWKAFPDAVRREIMDKGVWLRPSQYGDPYPITRGLIEDGRRHLIGGERWNPGRPIVIMHGRLDPDVPFAHSQALMDNLDGGWARLVQVPDGEHRLSRPEDIALLLELIEGVL